MSKVIVVVGFGPGISSAVADRFGAAGFSVALVARSQDRLAEGAKALAAKGLRAAAYPADAADPVSVRAAIARARAELGPVTVLHWNAYGGGAAGDLLAVDPASTRAIFDVGVVGLLAAVQESLPDLKKAGDGAVLVTNGAFGDLTPEMDALAVQVSAMGLALANASKHKLVGLLSERLKAEGVYLGEVMVAGTVKGTAWDRGDANLEAAAIAEKFWGLYQARRAVHARVS
jgi:NAD(P)-dependent dehydrogenase (short-subunit alcohol dehydrogenase family)